MLGALFQAPGAPEGPPALLTPGCAAFLAGQPPRTPAALTKPLRARGAWLPGWFLVHFRGPVTPEDQRWLDERTGAVRRSDGSELARWYVPDDTLVAWVEDEGTWRALASSPRSDWVGRYQPAYKLEATLAGAASDGPTLWSVDLLPGAAHARVAAELEALGARVLERVHHRGRQTHDLDFLVLEARARDLPRLAWVEGIRLVQEHRRAPAGAGTYPGELDAQAVTELSDAARSGRLWGLLPARTLGSGYDATRALLDLLAFDDPRLLIGLAGDQAGSPDEPLKNALTFPDASAPWGEGAAHRPERSQGTGASAALAEALWRTVGELGPCAPAEGRITRDVPAARGFASPRDAPHGLELLCLDAGAPLAFALVWTDEPGCAGPGLARINDLDLVVTAPDGTLYRGSHDGITPTVPSAERDRLGTAEFVLVPRPALGRWRVSVRPVRGAFSVRQGYALVAAGNVLDRSGVQDLAVPVTVTLQATGGRFGSGNDLAPADVALLRSRDDARLRVRDRESLTLAFDASVPAGATVSAVRVLVEHHEEPRVAAGDVQWKLAHGGLTGPTVVATTVAPLRSGPLAEALDLWAPATLVPDANTLKLVIQNDSRDDDTLLDEVHVEVDCLVADAPPRITSLPATTAILGQAYRYDGDGTAEASGTAPMTWSVTSAPAGFAIQATTGLVTWTPGSTGSFPVTIRAANALGAESQAFVVTVSSQAPLPATLLPNNAAPIGYCPPERLAFGAARGEQRLNVFLPRGTPPPAGWPAILNTRVGGGFAALPLARLDSTGATAPLHAFVASGIAVLDYGVPAIGGGEGLFYPPGHASGRYESFRPADDSPEKAGEWVLQWAKSQGTYLLDASRICLRGSSQGAMIALWAAMGPERARASGSLQVRTSTRVKGVLALQPPASMWAFDQDPTLASRMIAHFEQASLPGVPATALRQATRSLQEAASVMRFGFESTAARTGNQAQALCLLFNEPVKRIGGVVADLTLDATGYPRLTDALEQPLVHDSWSGYVLYRRLLDLSPASAAFHAANSVFAIRDTSALPAPQNWHTRTYSGAITGAAANAIAHQWVLRTLAN